MLPGYGRGYSGVYRYCLSAVASNVGSNNGTASIAESKHCKFSLTVNFLIIQTPKKFVVITIKFELCGSNIE